MGAVISAPIDGAPSGPANPGPVGTAAGVSLRLRRRSAGVHFVDLRRLAGCRALVLAPRRRFAFEVTQRVGFAARRWTFPPACAACAPATEPLAPATAVALSARTIVVAVSEARIRAAMQRVCGGSTGGELYSTWTRLLRGSRRIVVAGGLRPNTRP